jgi:hypothetical protein
MTEVQARKIQIDKAVEPLRVIGADKSNCPQTTAEVIKSRIDLEAALAAAEAERDRLRAALEAIRSDASWPQVIQFDEATFTEIVLEDAPYIVGSQIWCEPIYKMSDRTLIGFRAWTKDLKLPAPQEKA